MTTRLVTMALLLLVSGLVGCGSKSEWPANAPKVETPMPSGAGTKRALVLVEGDVPPPAKKAATRADELSTPRIVRKVLGDERP